jgi:hypothetical protein
MPRNALTFVLLTPLALAGCTDGSNGFLGDLTGNDREVRFRCDDDRSFRVSFNRDRDRATVDAGDQTYRLRLTDRDGDRRHYGEDGVRLTIDDDRARLRIEDGRDYSDCEET